MRGRLGHSGTVVEYSQLGGLWFRSSCSRFEAWAIILCSPLCLDSVSCINGIGERWDSRVEIMRMSSFYAVVSAWLDASKRS